MRRIVALITLVTLAACGGGASIPNAGSRIPQAASNPITKLKCFSGGTGSCTLTATGAYLNNGPNPGYSGVYISSADNLKGLPISSIGHLTFTYSGCCAGGGSPRFSLPISNDGGTTTIWTYIQGTTCGRSNADGGTVGIEQEPCTIYTSLGGAFSDWSAFLAAYPNAIVNGIPFVVADEPGQYTVTAVAISR